MEQPEGRDTQLARVGGVSLNSCGNAPEHVGNGAQRGFVYDFFRCARPFHGAHLYSTHNDDR